MHTHTGLPGDSSRNNDNISTSQDLLQAFVRGKVPDDLCGCRDVRQISRHTGSVYDIVQPQLWKRFSLE